VRSRAFDVMLPHKGCLGGGNAEGSPQTVLVPGADLFNHHPRARSEMRYDSKTKKLQLRTLQPHRRGQQVHVSYGMKSNAELLCLYGFSLIDNPADALPIDMMELRQRRLPHREAALRWRIAQLALGVPPQGGVVRLRLSGLRPSGMRLLRLLQLGPADFTAFNIAQLLRDQPVSHSNELHTAEAFFKMCDEKLRAFPESWQHDIQLLQGHHVTVNKRMQMIILARLSEKLLLQNCIEQVTVHSGGGHADIVKALTVLLQSPKAI